ncbi:hypothetical protein CHS0354_042282 [Potamilus streckersoni]|uniref:Sulfide:quinone oxidoreductase, mitochondrial n=1 Tax=Potamilus streckersoni TaxID=2493646 RepID=A0AAE0STH6_9BIVA|nr:hypothetical protein CHS0354_042282 [Potamilus streckersoni]
MKAARLIRVTFSPASARCQAYSSESSAPATDSGNKKHYPLVVIGGGAGGCSVAAKFCRKLGKGKVAVVEPAEYHYYQPMWTLVGSGLKTVDQSARAMETVLPKHCEWLKTRAMEFIPEKNIVHLQNGDQLNYDFLVVAMGIQLNYDKVKGLLEALKTDPSVCSNYWRETVEKTYPAIKNFKGGNAIFTFPNTPIKCAGAPQKIMYLAEEHWNKAGIRDKTNIMFNSSLGVLYPVKKYGDRLLEIVKERHLTLNLKRSLIEIRPNKKEAIFQKLDEEGKTETYKYDFIHVTPPMSAPDVLIKCTNLTDPTGFLSVNKNTLQHTKYPNIFGIGDCTNVPTSKTTSAVAAQCGVLEKSLVDAMAGKIPGGKYDGYTSCPLLVGYSQCILAEFDYEGQSLETFPFDQSKRRRSMYHVKKDILPKIYWNVMLKGHWNGPQTFRRIMHFGKDR